MGPLVERTTAEIDVLLAGADTRSGLSVARSLSSDGLSIAVAGHDPSNMVFRSNVAKHAVVTPSPAKDPEAYGSFVVEAVRRLGVSTVIPITDAALVALESCRSDFAGKATLAMPTSPSLRGALNKRVNLEIARRIGVPCPRQFELESLEQIPAMIEHLGWPIIIKNPGPQFAPGVRPFDFRVLVARDEDELRSHLASHSLTSHRREGRSPLFQECAVGKVHNLCCFAARGATIAMHEYRSIRRCDGAGALREIIEPTPELAQHARRLLRELEWDGVAHVAFFVHGETDRVWYMETNGRFWGSVEGSVQAGWNFPLWYHRYFRHGEIPTPGPLRVGSQTCWHRGDLEALIDYLFASGEPPTTGTEPGKIRAVLQYLSGWRPGIQADVFRWRDPWPAVVDHLDLARGLSGAAWRRLVRRCSSVPRFKSAGDRSRPVDHVR